ncbi:MAG TPA: 2-oxo-4-hydroxy-4-carboxy-5-ureidoimidazoline decarboxylase [Candidatus Limnocylindria bacterium]|nr:2-oxo-4-hydroxy-4-carboxy-5-ureidoimidazoline decarboxylase [Candidatus Limnocylindria bacterium]
MELPSVEALNALPADAFVETVAPLFEGAPRFLRRLADARPFDTDDALLDAAREVAAVAPDEELRELLDAHPRIGADPAAMSEPSRDEQGEPSEDQPVEEPGLAEDLANLNEIYEARFGFRYVIFVAGRPKSAIEPLMEVALRNDREAELRRGVGDAIYVAADRLRRLRDEAEAEEGAE